MTVNLKGMSKKQLEKLQKDVSAALAKIEEQEKHEAMQAERKKEALQAARETAKQLGFSLEELTGAAGAASTAPKMQGVAKYANPANPEQTWTGKGRKPNWFIEALEAGASAESLEI